MRRVKISSTDTLILSFFGSLYMTVIGMGLGLGGCIVIREVEQKINPRTPEYLAKEKKKELIKYINGDKRRIEEHEKTIESFNRYKESEHQNNTVRDIKAEIEYLNRSLDRWEHEKEVLDFAFCLKEEPPLMPEEMGFRKLFYRFE